MAQRKSACIEWKFQRERMKENSNDKKDREVDGSYILEYSKVEI